MNYHPLYNRYLLEVYEEEHGPHFDEKYAREAVSSMCSLREDGVIENGEHWDIDQIKGAIEPYRRVMSDEDTCWDAYVALHMAYHDMGKLYRKHGMSEPKLIEDAMEIWFNDLDAPEGKVWRYYHAMKKGKEE